MMRKDHILTVIIKKDILAKSKAILKLKLKHSQLEYKKRTRFQ